MNAPAIVISTWFDPEDPTPLVALPGKSACLLDECATRLAPGGLLFVYGAPWRLPAYGAQLMHSLTFKYWIGLALNDAPAEDGLPPTHLGLLLFWKPGGPFVLATDAARVPHATCTACGKTLKDWGGKRHLMNPRGTLLSDIWRDLPRQRIASQAIPSGVLARIATLAGHAPEQVVEPGGDGGSGRGVPPVRSPVQNGRDARSSFSPPDLDRVIDTDCLMFLDSLPAKVFDLCFADPPYNLAKLYSHYDDARAELQYRDWCERWLAGMARALKPGGSLFVLSLPRWGIDHALLLNQHLDFRRWIAWDALSDPRGKIMPAHYALLWYTKPGAAPVVNQLPAIDAPDYCLRAGCIKKRKAAGDERTVPLTDIWSDIHRLRHKRDRDQHPCQLPEKLLERIIRLTTRPGDVVFDPFGGTGTTGLVAQRLGRRFVLTELDPAYVKIARARIANLDAPRATIPRPRAAASKREIELYLQNRARELGRPPEEHEVSPAVLEQIDQAYPYRSAAFKRCRVVLERPRPSQRNSGPTSSPSP